MVTATILLILQNATLHIEKTGDEWQFIMECSFREYINQNGKAQLMYQDTYLGKYYPLKFFEDPKEIKIEGNQTRIILYKSYKEPYSLNYKAILKLDNGKVLESYINNYDESLLRSQVKHSTIDLYNDFIILKRIKDMLLNTFETDPIDMELLSKLSGKNNQRINLQSEAPLESRGKFAIEILIEVLRDIKDKGYSEGVRREKIRKFSALFDEYFNSLGFYFVDNQHANKLMEELKRTLGNNKVTSEIFPLIIKLSNVLPEFTHDLLKEIIRTIQENGETSNIPDRIEEILSVLTEMIDSSQKSVSPDK